MDKKDAKRKTIRDQTLLLNEVRTFTGKHLTQSDLGEVSRAVTNTGKYAVPVYYVRVQEEDPKTISQRLALIREKISVFSEQGIILCIKGGETAPQGWERVNLTVEDQREIDRMRTMFKRVELLKLEWEGNRITATRTTDPVLNSRTAAAVLWSPADKNALPSPVDMKHAKEAIITLEDAIRDAFESTKLHIAKMEKDLMERKGWIAPIRKVPTEILVDIILRASEMDDLAPVMFTAVSRLWRSITLATPRAWSFIHLKQIYQRDIYSDHDYFSSYSDMYFERSKPRLLHLNLPRSDGFWLNWVIKQQADRIMCLTMSTAVFISESQSPRQCQPFQYLQTLTVAPPDGGDRASLDPSFFSISRFPALQNLRLPPHCQSTGTNHTISPGTFPPLQHLTVEIGTTSACMDILQSCAATLKTLSIRCFENPRTTGSPLGIAFPLLRCLKIGRDASTSPHIVKAITPVLSSLVVDSRQYSMPVFFDADMQNVTHMRWNEFKAPPICTRVRVLQTMVDPDFTDSKSRGYADCANKLKEIAAAYPSLETIEIRTVPKGHNRLHLMQQKVEECLGEEFVKPKLVWTKRWQEDLPWYVAETCGKNMPCVPLPRNY